MASRARRSLALVALLLFLGIVVGTVLGEAIGLMLPEGKVLRDVFVNTIEYHAGPVHLDLVVFSFTFASGCGGPVRGSGFMASAFPVRGSNRTLNREPGTANRT